MTEMVIEMKMFVMMSLRIVIIMMIVVTMVRKWHRSLGFFFYPFFMKKESWVHGKTGACGFAGPNTDLGFFPLQLPIFIKYEERKL